MANRPGVAPSKGVRSRAQRVRPYSEAHTEPYLSLHLFFQSSNDPKGMIWFLSTAKNHMFHFGLAPHKRGLTWEHFLITDTFAIDNWKDMPDG